MKKSFAFAFLALLTVHALNAQESMFNLGDKVINLGIGIGTGYSALSTYNSTVVPPISISYEQAFKDDILEKGVIGLGAYVGYYSYKWHYVYSTYDGGYKYSNIIIGARGSFHYPFLDKLDTYFGVLIGYNIRRSTEFGTWAGYDYTPDTGGIAYSGFVGGRYYFSDKFSGFAELGYGIAYLTLGLGVRL